MTSLILLDSTDWLIGSIVFPEYGAFFSTRFLWQPGTGGNRFLGLGSYCCTVVSFELPESLGIETWFPKMHPILQCGTPTNPSTRNKLFITSRRRCVTASGETVARRPRLGLCILSKSAPQSPRAFTILFVILIFSPTRAAPTEILRVPLIG